MESNQAMRVLLLRQCGELAAARAQRHFLAILLLAAITVAAPALWIATVPLIILCGWLAFWALRDARQADQSIEELKRPRVAISLPITPPIPKFPPAAAAAPPPSMVDAEFWLPPPSSAGA